MQLALATRKPSDSEFRVGDLVRVKAGELMPDRSPTIWRGAIDGAEGVVSEISRDPDTAELQFHVTLNHQTLERMPQDYQRYCRERGLHANQIVLFSRQLEHFDWSSAETPSW